MSKCPTKEQLLRDVLSELSWFEIAEKYSYTDARFLRKKAVQWGLPPRRKILKPTKAELSDMIFNRHMTPNQIAHALGYGEGGWSNIYAYCRKYGLELLTPLSIAVWYLDDGSLNKRYHTIVLCTNSFSHAGQLLAIDYFKHQHGIDAVLEPRRNQQTVIRINASQSRKFMDLVAPHVPSCMSYKLW